MSDPVTTAPSLPLAEAADLVEQAQEVDLDPDELEPDLADLPLESDAADVVEQRLAVGYDDGREAEGPAL